MSNKKVTQIYTIATNLGNFFANFVMPDCDFSLIIAPRTLLKSSKNLIGKDRFFWYFVTIYEVAAWYQAALINKTFAAYILGISIFRYVKLQKSPQSEERFNYEEQEKHIFYHPWFAACT
jgi:hypothetical protein